MNKLDVKESVIDFPKNGLCPFVWEVVSAVDGSAMIWKLTRRAEMTIQHLVDFIVERNALFKQLSDAKQLNINITGSITSNSYTKNADIDIHFNSPKFYDVDEKTQNKLNTLLKTIFDEFKNRYSEEYYMIETHPIEVYFQTNEFQDYMSVGCYDFVNKRWLVGPDMADTSFNPYSEYYRQIKLKSEKIVKNIRNMILDVYEQAIVCKKIFNKNDVNLFETELQNLKNNLFKAGQMFDSARSMRKAYTSPTSKEEALANRNNRKWKIADATFKLFDKYGYLSILKEFKNLYSVLESPQMNQYQNVIFDQIIKIVKNNIGNVDKLEDKEMNNTTETANSQVNEGKLSNMLLATLLAIPGILPAKHVKKSIDTQPTYSYIVNDINAKCKKIGQYTSFQAANIIARTLFAEARNDGVDGMTAVASVIYNRANGKASDFANVCKKNGYSKKYRRLVHQFSCWNKMTNDEWLPNKFKVKLPKAVVVGSSEQKLWEQAMLITAEMLAGTFKPVTKANMYYNPEKASPDWGDELKNTEYYGKHKFGYLKNHSPFV